MAKDAPLESAIRASFAAKDLQAGTAWSSQGSDFFFAVESATEPTLILDDKAAGVAMLPVLQGKAAAMHSTEPTGQQPKLWFATAHLAETGRNHAFHYLVEGKEFGGLLDLPAFGPLSYLQPGVPSASYPRRSPTPAKFTRG